MLRFLAAVLDCDYIIAKESPKVKHFIKKSSLFLVLLRFRDLSGAGEANLRHALDNRDSGRGVQLIKQRAALIL